MKKSIFLIAILALIGATTAVAQPRAIGLNLGYGLDVSYQHTLSESNFIDLSVNIPAFSGIGATATYDWVNPFGTAIPWNYKGEWNWNLGVGAGLGVYNPFRTYTVYNEHGELVKEWGGKIYAGAVGHVGVEYNFWFPLQLSVDYRPNIGFAVTGDGGCMFNGVGLFSGITLGVRYLF